MKGTERTYRLKAARIFYHVAPEGSISSILGQGLRSREVYVSKSLETAKDWTENLIDNDEERMAVLQIRVPKGTKIVDRTWPETETVIQGHVEPTNIKVVGYYNPEKGTLVRGNK